MQQLRDIWQGSRYCCGLDVEQTENGYAVRAMVVLRFSGKVLELVRLNAEPDGLDEVLKLAKKYDYPIALNFFGKGYLTRSSAGKESGSSSLLPVMDTERFYTQQFDGVFLRSSSAIAREHVDELLARLSEEKLKVCHVSLGVWIVENLSDQLPEGNILIHNQICVFENQGVQSVQRTGETDKKQKIKIDGLPVEMSTLAAYGAAFAGLLGGGNFPSIDPERFNDLIETQRSRSSLMAKLARIAAILITAYGINMVISTWVNAHTAGESREQQFEEQTRLSNQRYRDRIIQSDSLLNTALAWGKGIKPSYMFSSVINRVPKGVMLTRMSFGDTEANRKEKKAMHSGFLRVTGTSETISRFTEMLFALRSLPWVGQVKIIKYQEQKETEAVLSAFSIDIFLK